MITKLSGPCTCYRFWLLFDTWMITRTAAAKQAFDSHVDTCIYCRWWHSQPLPELPQ